MGVSKNHLRFVSLGVSAFAGIGPQKKVEVKYPDNFDITKELEGVEAENGVVIVFPEGYKYVEIEGNQGVGKTSLIECLKEATGGLAAENTEHITEGEGGTIVKDKRYGERFYGEDGELYNLKVTKTTTTLEQIKTDPKTGKPVLNAKNKEESVIMKSPKTLLQKIIGPAGISPMKLKAMNGPAQVAWVKGLFNLGTEEERFENDLKVKYDTAYKERTRLNNEFKRLETLLNVDPYNKEHEKWQKYFDTTKLEDLQKEVEQATKNKNLYEKAESILPDLKFQKAAITKDIDDINAEIEKLIAKRNEKTSQLEIIEDRIVAGEGYLVVHKHHLTEYDALKEKITEANDYNKHKLAFDQMLALKKDMDKTSDDLVIKNGQVNEYAKLKQEYIKKFTPDIPEFEICIKGEGDEREGLFYKKRSLAILAESELWELATQLWKAMNVKIIYVENVSSLGTGAIEKFNDFLKNNGAYIFGTKMNRAESNLKISFHNEIPL